MTTTDAVLRALLCKHCERVLDSTARGNVCAACWFNVDPRR